MCRIFFFFQAEDGIRDLTVTGVQTCALPISVNHRPRHRGMSKYGVFDRLGAGIIDLFWGMWLQRRAPRPHPFHEGIRSGERRVGKEGRSRWSPDHLKKKNKATWTHARDTL